MLDPFFAEDPLANTSGAGGERKTVDSSATRARQLRVAHVHRVARQAENVMVRRHEDRLSPAHLRDQQVGASQEDSPARVPRMSLHGAGDVVLVRAEAARAAEI